MQELSPELIKELQEISKLPIEKQKAKLPAFLAKLSPEQKEWLLAQQKKVECPFCKIAKGEIQARKVYEDASFLAILDIKPANPGHILVIPRDHIQFLPQLPDELDRSFFSLIKKLSKAVFEATGAQGTNILINQGKIAGQLVPHLHVHIIPRFEKDGLETLSRPWSPKELKEEQFAELQRRIAQSAKKYLEKKPVLYDMAGKPVEEKPKEEKRKKLKRIRPRLP